MTNLNMVFNIVWFIKTLLNFYTFLYFFNYLHMSADILARPPPYDTFYVNDP